MVSVVVCLFVYVLVCLFVCLCIGLFVCLFVCLICVLFVYVNSLFVAYCCLHLYNYLFELLRNWCTKFDLINSFDSNIEMRMELILQVSH